MSSEDHPDWWRPTGGQNSQDSILERRSLVWNDDGVVAPVAPPASYEDVDHKGKFFTRGCRGMIEQLQIYCIRTAAGTLTLRYSPHPCLGPINTVTITPGATWAWVAVDIEEMWDYDSLFIWVYECDADVSWAYDAVQPYDGHWSTDVGATWEDMAIRPFIRAVYTGETPGDVPVSGILNIIPIPSVSSARVFGNRILVINVETTCVDIHGAGYTDLITLRAVAAPGSDSIIFRIYCDEILAYAWYQSDLNVLGMTPSTPGVSLLNYAVAGDCTALITKRFEFRRRIRVTAEDGVGGVVAQVVLHPTLMR